MTTNVDTIQQLTGDEVATRLKGILKALGVSMILTGARVSAVFPDGAAAYYEELTFDTEEA